MEAKEASVLLTSWEITCEFNRRPKEPFDRKNIEIPFPYITLYAGQDKNGRAAPIHIVTDLGRAAQ